MNVALRVIVTSCLALTGVAHICAQQSASESELLRARESVWRAWFDDDQNALAKLVPTDTIVISSGESQWKHQAEILKSADSFHLKGGKLLRLEFPQTEIQHFGEVAILYSKYLYETQMNGKKEITFGRVTEVFVYRDGRWTNPGWHTDEEH